MADIKDYEKQVYAGILGKTIGVYMGRPFEQWHRPAIKDKWGVIDRYVHEDQGVPLVVSDDDISGTLTFVRALEDSGLYEHTTAEAFGQAWLNYIMERRTILWWGGYGMSTEHTAFLNLRNGMSAPASGSTEVNGAVVSEQIGAQIFIDAIGMVTPGEPDLSVKLAREAASVSHDGEAVHAACVVAAMVSAAFVEKDMGRLLDIGIGFAPDSSAVAAVHQDVRDWSREDGDWEKTYERIDAKYGYSRFGGTCHVIPNHALMVMAWSYAGNDFYESQRIINSAGWDTDCNAANVGSVMGVKLGLEGVNQAFEFQNPFADRLIIPTAEGTRSVSDVLNESLRVARVGRRVMRLDDVPPPKKGAVHHFTQPGSLHGYMAEETGYECRGTTQVENAYLPGSESDRALAVRFRDLKPGRISRISTPVMAHGPGAMYGTAQQVQSVPQIYPGNTLTVRGRTSDDLQGRACIRLFIRCSDSDDLVFSPPLSLTPSIEGQLVFKVPEGTWPAQDVGIEIRGSDASGTWYLDGLWIDGCPSFQFPDLPGMGPGGIPTGWISDVDQVILRPFPSDTDEFMRLGNNTDQAVMVTGTTAWRDYMFQADISVHLARSAGLVARYQGLQRYLSLTYGHGRLNLTEMYYGETVLDQHDVSWSADETHRMAIQCEDHRITAFLDDEPIMSATHEHLENGGSGFLIDRGLAGFRSASVQPV